ncbi:MAG: CCA tRNA nucleotidyltransferase [Stutzerimonas stutzeri]|nr:MAG: CCA tRNA nucleotidyltransferase [Stutzerimonas stutzeri]
MSTRNILDIPTKLAELKDRFAKHGFELWFVGGCVRDSLMGVQPKDIDLTTSATPEEAIAIYRLYEYSYHETGLQHGTITVVLDHVPYEITTYRIDAETDGRHASVVYTRDLYQDLFRRDLTMNAIAMGFDGEIFDPFGGVDDIEANLVRFVGNAEDRLREDYLRILRWFRFYGRFGAGKAGADEEAFDAIKAAAPGLKQISVERVWSEVSKIIAGPHGIQIMDMMQGMGVAEIIGLPAEGNNLFLNTARGVSRNPAFLMAAYYGEKVTSIASRWKWSNDERQAARFLIDRNYFTYSLAEAKRDVLEGRSRELASGMLRMRRRADEAAMVDSWVVPAFPVSGQDLIAQGMVPGPEMGQRIKTLREQWIASDYTLSKSDMIGV